jgi:hypothetical protein
MKTNSIFRSTLKFEKVGRRYSTVGDGLKPPVEENRRHSFGGEGSERLGEIAGSSSNSALDNQPKKRGLFAKLKDKAIGTKEEREAEKRHRAEVCSHISYVMQS